MKNRSKLFATSLIIFLSIGIFSVAGVLQAAEADHACQAMVEGAKQMMDGNQKVMEIMAKKGMKDQELMSAEMMMKQGYDTMLQGQQTMATNNAEGTAMVQRGGKMMLDAQKTTYSVVEKKGMVTECSIGLDSCTYGEKKIKEGALEWFFGSV
ncbi:exported hypothetical protein [Syntrophobacter sp. SbD1]|nr:exported hypothetical protein [Syntrophobacter sp. SbD1]